MTAAAKTAATTSRSTASTSAVNDNKTMTEEAVAASGGNESVAVNILFDRVKGDPAFLQRELPALLRRWCQSQVGLLLTAQRAKAWTPQKQTHNPQRLNAAIRANLLDFPLPKGKRLGDASADDLSTASAYYIGVANTNSHKARWLDAIAAKMGNAHRVEDALTETELQRLQEEVV